MSYNLNINFLTNKEEITKQVFQAKPPGRNGLLVQVHHTINKGSQKQIVRFIYACFDKLGNILVANNHSGNIVLIDLDRSKYWVLSAKNSCTVLKFSTYNAAEIILGIQNGALYIINIETGDITGQLICHDHPVLDITFSRPHICLSASKNEAIIWDLRSNSKIQVLTLLQDCHLKHVMFIPVMGDVLACFDDNTILVWKYGTFEVLREIQRASWYKSSIKSIAFTRNGRAMIFAGHLPQLTIFMIDTWTVANTVILPDYIMSIKKIAFIPQMFDGGSNKVLAILSGSGVLYFYDMENDEIINKIVADNEILKFDCSMDGKYIACILRSGEINIYAGAQYIKIHPRPGSVKKKIVNQRNRNIMNQKRNLQLSSVQKEISDFLDVDKLQAILKEFGEYPDSYRSKIWAQLLQLPNNKKQYNNCINYISSTSFENLTLENKSALQNLKKLLSNLITWCPYFTHVTYLPVFVFPFTKIFQNEPIYCFEAACTIILNWCQHWFEYFPLPPINILAIIENILLEQDADLLNHLTLNNVTSKMYAWPLLEAAFSEVITGKQWCQLWDHILSNEPSFLMMSVIAYNLCNRQVLLSFNNTSDFEHFYHNQNMVDMKKLISKSYSLLNNTSDKNHPRRFLSPFKCLPNSTYPSFAGFPKNFINFNFDEVVKLKNEQKEIEHEKERMLTQRQILLKNLEIAERQKVEEDRLKEMEEACRHKIIEETERVKEQRSHINELRRQLQIEEIEILNKSREKILARNTKQRQHALEQLIDDVEQNRAADERELAKAEGDLAKHYAELLHHKIKLEESLHTDIPSSGLSNDYRLLKIQQHKLVESLEAIKNGSDNSQQLKNITLATGISAMDDLILRIEMELAQQMADRYENVTKGHSAIKVVKLESETKELEMEVSKLLSVLADVKSRETKQRLHELHDNVQHKRSLQKSYRGIEKPDEVHRKISYVNSFGDDFVKLREMIQQACDPTPNESEEELSEELEVISLESN